MRLLWYLILLTSTAVTDIVGYILEYSGLEITAGNASTRFRNSQVAGRGSIMVFCQNIRTLLVTLSSMCNSDWFRSSRRSLKNDGRVGYPVCNNQGWPRVFLLLPVASGGTKNTSGHQSGHKSPASSAVEVSGNSWLDTASATRFKVPFRYLISKSYYCKNTL